MHPLGLTRDLLRNNVSMPAVVRQQFQAVRLRRHAAVGLPRVHLHHLSSAPRAPHLRGCVAAAAAKITPPSAVAVSTPAATEAPEASSSASSSAAAAVTGGGDLPSDAPFTSGPDAAAAAGPLLAAAPALPRTRSLQDIQAATSDKLLELQHAVSDVGTITGTEQLSEVLHQLEQLEHDLSAALHQVQVQEQQAAVKEDHTAQLAAAAAVGMEAGPESPASSTALSAAAEAAAAPDAYLVVDDPLTTLAGSQLPLAGAFDPQLKAAASADLPEVSVMASSLPMTSAAAAAAEASSSSRTSVIAPAAAAAVEMVPTSEMEAAAAAAAMGAGALGSFDWGDVPFRHLPHASPAASVSTLDEPISTPSTISGTAAPDNSAIDSAKLWALFVLGLSYVHQATTGFALPALLPMISPSLHLSDFQGALLTSGYSYLYALALVPVGLLADRVKRPQLLAVGLMLWSSLSIVASGAKSFGDLLLLRVGFAAAQATQNPVAFSLIPDLFPANKSTALAGYNCAIYLGRALSFASVLAAHRLEVAAAAGAAGAEGAAGAASDIGLSMVPLDALDLQRMSIIYTAGDMAAVTPVYNYNFNVIAYEGAAGMDPMHEGWRDVLSYIGLPGFFIAAMMMLSVREPRDDMQKQQQQQQQQQKQQQQLGSGLSSAASSSAGSATDEDAAAAAATAASSSSAAAHPDWRTGVENLAHKLPLDAVNRVVHQAADAFTSLRTTLTSSSSSDPAHAGNAAPAAGMSSVQKLIKMPAFQTTTFAASLNDVGSYALIAWHSTFYERVYHLDSSVYAPMLAIILPVGGILGGLGGGLIGDHLSAVGGRQWLTAGASVMAAPFVMQSLLAENHNSSFLALLVGFALSEAWRAPSAIMIRSIAPQELGSTASALYLCARNLVGGLGPVAVAKLAEVVGLQHAMLLAPCCYVGSGLLFLLAEKEIEEQHRKERQERGLLAGGVAAPAPEASS